ncbi:MAG TPA: ATP-binding protein, partial [Bauldia sp.]|nr:ATP-binding protein [Bauldia sp.]
MPANSLAARLIALAALWSVLALGAAALIITSLYRDSAESAFDERLGVYLTTLVGLLANQSPSALADPGNLSEQRFENPYSGWYWQVSRDGAVVLASKSLFNDTLAVPAEAARRTVAEGVVSFDLAGPAGQTLRAVDRKIDFGPGNVYDVVVAGDAGDVQADIAGFRRSVLLTLGAFGVILILSTLIQVRWGLRPLDRVRQALAALRSGKETRIGGRLPAEIEPLARELNALLQSNQEIIERARTQVGNLAHALKTPLSVITNEARAAKGPLADKMAEQAEIMRRQVNHYLDRARIAARSNVIGALTPVEPAVQRLVRAMKRIHGDRGIAIEATIAAGAVFRGEQQDLEEIVGNLVDNACKWAKTRVAVMVARLPGRDGDPDELSLIVDDDGPGLPPEKRAEAARRGQRLDESKPGSGLGLSIVTELVELYEGSFALETSPAGGLRAAVR